VSAESLTPRRPNRYAQLIEHIFTQRYTEGATEVPFQREDIERAAQDLNVKLPKNLGDQALPVSCS
jgi:hypothetical protein